MADEFLPHGLIQQALADSTSSPVLEEILNPLNDGREALGFFTEREVFVIRNSINREINYKAYKLDELVDDTKEARTAIITSSKGRDGFMMRALITKTIDIHTRFTSFLSRRQQKQREREYNV